MIEMIRTVVQPVIDEVSVLKKYDDKLDELLLLKDSLEDTDPLEMTLHQYTEWKEVQNFFEHTQKQKDILRKTRGISIGNNSSFHKIGYILSLEMEQDEELYKVAERFNKAVLSENKAMLDDMEAAYLEVFERVYNRVFSSIEGCINDYFDALKYLNNSRWRSELKGYLPQPLTTFYIKQFNEYEVERKKHGEHKVKKPIIRKTNIIPDGFGKKTILS